ncbi:MAG: hypothetical protein OEY03_04140 [Rhizobacter sp.]|nr:hypothetical protein [Rhizobacter sp.]
MPLARVLSATLLALVLSACVIAPYRPSGAVVVDDDTVASTEAPPPAPYVEVIPVAPFVGAVWLAGYWGLSAGRHVWIGGHWVRPRAGYYWSPYRWAPYGGRWHLHRGGWRRH